MAYRNTRISQHAPTLQCQSLVAYGNTRISQHALTLQWQSGGLWKHQNKPACTNSNTTVSEFGGLWKHQNKPACTNTTVSEFGGLWKHQIKAACTNTAVSEPGCYTEQEERSADLCNLASVLFANPGPTAMTWHMYTLAHKACLFHQILNTTALKTERFMWAR